MPVDEVERRITQLEIERENLRKETDKASLERLIQLDKTGGPGRKNAAGLTAQWQHEKDAIQHTSKLKEELRPCAATRRSRTGQRLCEGV